MIFAAHSDAAYLNVSKARSHAGAHIMLSEDVPVPSFNGPVLTLSQIIEFFASSATEAKLAGLYVCAKEMVPLRNSLVKMGWPQPKSPIQTNNTTALGVANKTIITHKMKSKDMRLWWLRSANPMANSATSGVPAQPTTQIIQQKHIRKSTPNP
eukprot:CCRYP_002936-RA/>CCRYP_002936-RA protein AED:0.42 eAED:0.44 QI:0/-1/0/1/-1/1/1/0/153